MIEKIKGLLIGVVVLVIGVQVAWAVIAPYMSWIGMTLAIVVIVLLILGALAAILAVFKRFGGWPGGGTFNG